MSSSTPAAGEPGTRDPSPAVQRVMATVGWVVAGVPLAYGLVQTVRRASALFTG